jgi:hypothetical protein
MFSSKTSSNACRRTSSAQNRGTLGSQTLAFGTSPRLTAP